MLLTDHLSNHPDSLKKVKVVNQPSKKDQRIDEIARYCSKGWLPINPNVLDSLRNKVRQFSERELVSEVAKDPGLAVYLARSVAKMDDLGDQNQGMLCRIASVQRSKLEALLMVPERTMSSHKIRMASRAQVERLQFSVAASQFATVCIESIVGNADKVLEGVLMKQLGNDLLCWSYPRVFAQAQSAADKGSVTLEAELERLIGVSPDALALKFAGALGLARETSALLSDKSTKTDTDPGKFARELAVINEISGYSESFAKKFALNHYPLGQLEWEGLEIKVAEKFGPGAAAQAQERLVEILQSLAEVCPRAEKLELVQQTQKKLETLGIEHPLFVQNTYALRCPPALRQGFVEAYALIDQGQFSVQAIQYLSDKLAPAIGFTRGCLYLYNEAEGVLRPSLRIGYQSLQGYEQFLKSDSRSLQSSIYSSAPFRKPGIGVTGDQVLQVFGALASQRYLGVLYLELPVGLDADPKFPVINYFHAVNQSIGDALGS